MCKSLSLGVQEWAEFKKTNKIDNQEGKGMGFVNHGTGIKQQELKFAQSRIFNLLHSH
jgi:hypothetical protein